MLELEGFMQLPEPLISPSYFPNSPSRLGEFLGCQVKVVLVLTQGTLSLLSELSLHLILQTFPDTSPSPGHVVDDRRSLAGRGNESAH